MNYSIGLTLRYFIFYKQTQNKKAKACTYINNIYNTQHKRQDPIPRQYRTPDSAAITITAFTRDLFYASTLTPNLFAFLPRPSHTGHYFSLLLFYSFTHFLLLSLLTPKRRSSHSFTQDFLPLTTPKRQLFPVYHRTPFPLNHSQALCHGSFPPEDDPCLPLFSPITDYVFPAPANTLFSWRYLAVRERSSLVGVPLGHCVKWSAAVCFSPR